MSSPRSAKEIRLEPISSALARRITRALHYSGKVVNNSTLHFGVFLDGRCGGVLSFGPSLDKRKTLGLVANTPWNGYLELNRMALAEWLPRNSESRSIAVALLLIRRRYPWVRWVLTYADACSCGDGTIYRAAGFLLTMVRKNTDLLVHEGKIVHSLAQKTGKDADALFARTQGASRAEGSVLKGHQLRYIALLDPSARADLRCEVLPYGTIAEAGASMYRGKSRAPEA